MSVAMSNSKSINDIYAEKQEHRLQDLQDKVKKLSSENLQLSNELQEYQIKYEDFIRDSKKETFPRLSEFCTEMNKYLNVQEAENNKQMSQLVAFEQLMNFNDPFKNKFMLKERQRKTKDVQTDDINEKIPLEVLEYFEQDKFEIGRPEFKWLFDYFDVQLLRDFKKNRTWDKFLFTEKINTYFTRYAIDSNQDQSFRNFVLNIMISIGNREKFLNELMFLVHTSYAFADTTSRISEIGNHFGS